jgi:HK97 gp10 family phage protein
MKVAMRFEGGAKLTKALDTLALKPSQNVMRAALKVGAEPIRAEASMRAPRAPGAPDIADNIAISNAKVKGEMAAVKIGPAKGYAYGLPLEIGTSKMQARPFMRPAFDLKASVALMMIGQALWAMLIAKGAIASARTAGGSGDLE